MGVPPNYQTELRGIISGGGAAASSSAGVSELEVKNLEAKLNVTTKEKELYEKAVSHSSHLLNGLLFPAENESSSSSHRDPFTTLTNSDGWYQNATSLPVNAPNDEHPSILRSCTLELTIDYCTRVTTRETNSYLAELNAIPENETFPTLDHIESRLMDDVRKTEPYCGLIESCILTNFEGEECRPPKCPSENEAACRYVESCFDPNVQNEYGLALGLIVEGEKSLNKDFGSGSGSLGSEAAGMDQTKGEASSGGSGNKAGVGGWGVPIN